MEPVPLLDIEALTVRRDGVTLLEGIDLRVPPAAIHALVGPNGGGKTTLLLAVLGQVPFEGSIRCHWRREGRIGFVPQRLDVDRELPMTVEDFLAMRRQLRPVCLGAGAETRRRVGAALESVGLRDRARRRLGVLSGGEIQRVLLAQALEPAPELLLLDEPTAGIDAEGMRTIEAILLRLKREEGVTTLMVSHDLDQVRRIGDRVTGLNRTVRWSGTPQEALADVRGPAGLHDA